MGQKVQAKWTVMIYANGSNELQPEIWQSKLAAEKVSSSNQVNAVIQISQEKSELAAMLRPNLKLPTCQPKWSGARRYFLTQGKSKLIKDLGRTNMADPVKLYEFIIWAVTEYPAERYMLVLSGHGYQFVGALTDYSQQAPYIMGFPEMELAIRLACQKTKVKIDILIADLCSFNFVEVIYELAKDAAPSVHNVITYDYSAPVAGLDYKTLLLTLQENNKTEVQQLCRLLLEAFDSNLVAIKIDHKKLERVKYLYHRIAKSFDESGDKTPLYLLALLSIDRPWCQLIAQLETVIQELVKASNKLLSSKALLYIANKTTHDQARLKLYNRLAFTQDNAWTYLLSDKTYQPEEKDQEIVLKPRRLLVSELAAYVSIMNPTLELDEIREILQRLYEYKKWQPD